MSELEAEMETAALVLALKTVTPSPLKGFSLLTTSAPLEAAAVREAVLELIAYTNACGQALQRVGDLQAVPLMQGLDETWCL